MDKEDMVHVCNGILPSHKNNEIMLFVTTWIDLEIIMLSEVNHRGRQVPYDLSYIWSLKMIQINLFTQEK